jgi:steroid delta-isomerase-like uncharacterized protein
MSREENKALANRV